MRQPLPLLLLGALLACKDAEPVDDTGPIDSGPAEVGVEDCDGVDDDGDGLVDEGLTVTYYWDADGDGFGDPDRARDACGPEAGYVNAGEDCDDRDPEVHPGAAEVCDGVDNDCDGTTDQGAEGSADWYADGDGDGFGAGEPEVSCAAPDETHVLQDGDCDDGDAAVHPGALEQCDGVDSDCDPDNERSIVTFLPADGAAPESWTERFAEGAAFAPVTRVVSRAGTLRFCPGTYFTSLRVRADLGIEGYGDADEIVLSAELQHGVVIARTDGVTLSLSSLTLERGLGVGVVLEEQTAGGGVECDGLVDLTMSDVIVQDSRAGVGAGIYLRGCTATLSDVTLRDNVADYYGGGLALLGGEATLERVTVQDNVSDHGGGLAVVGYDGDARLSLVDSLVQDNTANRLGGGAVVESGTLDCAADPAEIAGFLANTADSGGGVYLSPGGAVTSTDCDWGSGSSENDPEDVSSVRAAYGDDETFACDASGCVP
ncbi:MAG: hypothetical protein H6739_22175 [Alphaproteobacteria bacterium]|nr:hypothetical protein [Alphaproteobacteria bacterium]